MKYIKKGSAAVIIAAVLVLTAGMGVFAAAQTQDLTRREALQAALADAGLKRSQVRSVEAEKERNTWEIEFIRKRRHTEYDYKIAAASGLVKKAEAEYRHALNTSTERIGKKAAQKAVADFSGFSLKTVRSGSCKYKKDGREWIYQIKFRKGHYRYEYEVLAPTGKIIETEKKYRK